MENKSEIKTTYAQELLRFIKASPTAYHAVKEIQKLLDDHRFCALQERDHWVLQSGGRYYVTRNDSSILAFTIPMEPATGYRVVSTHTDSPAFKLKDAFDRPSEGYAKLNVEKYGGMICSSWMDRPLSIAGRVLLATEQGFRTEYLDFSEPMAIIPNVAIHMERNANDGKSYNAQVDMLPLLGIKNDNESFKNKLAREICADAGEILAHDLYLYVAQDGYVWGEASEMLSAPRLDDLACVYGGLTAFCQSLDQSKDSVSVFAAFDNEEVGSQTLQGAASSFLADTLERIEYFLGNADGCHDGKFSRLAGSWMISADNAHAVHPNHPEYADAQNRPVLGGGIVLKFNAQQRYATDAIGAALFKRLAALAGASVQSYANRSDMPGGSTLGNIASTRVPLRTVDIGLPQLAMHSAFESMSCDDLVDYIVVCDAFYRAHIDGSDAERRVTVSDEG